MSPADLLKRSLFQTLGWGATVATVHLTIGVALILALNVPPMTGFTALSVPMEIALALPIGLLLTPLFKVPRGEWLHPLGMAVAWLGFERWVAVDPTKLEMWIAPTVVATVLFTGLLAARRFWKPILGVGLVLPVVLIAAPEIAYRMGDYQTAPNPNRGKAPEGAPDILFIVMDTTRAKAVHSLGYERDTTPNFDRFASEGLTFTQANSPATWSLPAHASLFTGHYPSSHEAHDETRFLDTRLPTIASTLAGMGWETRAFSANPYISDTFGLTRGFDATDQAWKSGEGGRQFSFIYRMVDKLGFAAEDKGGAQVVENIRGWLGARPKDAPPAFVFVNFLEAHFPFNQLPEEFLYAYTDAPYSKLSDASQTAFGVQFGRQLTDAEIGEIHQPLQDMYDGGVKYTDHLVGEVLDAFRERGTLDDTIVVILGDHGEMVGEHRAYGHVTSLYQPDLHVPLAFRYPKKIPAGGKRDDPVSTAATFATLFDLAGLEPTQPLQTPSLLDDSQKSILIAERYEEKMLSSRFAPGTANGKGPLLMPTGRYRSFRDGDWKLVFWTGDNSWHLYDLSTDPGEEKDLAADPNHWKLQGMKDLLSGAEIALQLPPIDKPVGADFVPKKMTKEECEQLKALGYIAEDEPCN